jgi:hypothetical protein
MNAKVDGRTILLLRADSIKGVPKGPGQRSLVLHLFRDLDVQQAYSCIRGCHKIMRRNPAGSPRVVNRTKWGESCLHSHFSIGAPTMLPYSVQLPS